MVCHLRMENKTFIRLGAGGKPSTWFSPERTRRANLHPKHSRDKTGKHRWNPLATTNSIKNNGNPRHFGLAEIPSCK